MARRRRERALTAITASLCATAGDLAERYRLRGYDRVHLASFLEVARHAGLSDVRFSSFDDHLNVAAGKALRSHSRASRGR